MKSDGSEGMATGSESAAHRELKRLAVGWALGQRLALFGTEVRLPRSGYRADVAAATPRVLSSAACTAVFECKASRADFRRDSAGEVESAREAEELRAQLLALREAIGGHYPDLRRGEELFPQFDAIDLRGLRHRRHDQLTRRLRAAERRSLEGTKFARLARWRAASLFYLVTEPGLVAPAEVPEGWGWLERAAGTLVLRMRPCLHATTAEERVAFVERIAAATAAGARRGLGIPWEGAALKGSADARQKYGTTEDRATERQGTEAQGSDTRGQGAVVGRGQA